MRAKTRRFTLLQSLLGLLLLAPATQAAVLARRCRRACVDEIAGCVAAGGHRAACRKETLGRCRTEGLTVCQGTAPQRAALCKSRRGHSCTASTTSSTTTTSSTSTTRPPTTTTSTTTTTLPTACNSPTIVPAQGGTFTDTTSGASSQAGTCGSSGASPEKV